jgi:hypothetical protein
MSRNPFIDEDEFLRGYLECAVWSGTDPVEETPLDEDYGYEDIDPAWREVAREDCAVFCRNNAIKLKEFGELTDRSAADLGHDFWLTRSGYGAGFWDRYMDAESGWNRDRAKTLGDDLSEASKVYGERNLMPIGQGLIGE